MNIKFILAFLTCFCIPVLAYGQVYQCKNADGTVRFSDQPCPGSLGAPVIDNSSDTSQIVEDMLHNKNPSKEQTLRFNKLFDQKKKRCHDSTLEGCEDYFKALDQFDTDLVKLCKKGDIEACKITCKNTLAFFSAPPAPAEEFLTCAKVNELIHGDFWVLIQGRPMYNTQLLDPGLVADALTPRFPAGKHNYGNMTMKCFRKKIAASKVEPVDYKVDENLYVSKGANGPVFRRTFSLETPRSDNTVKQVMPEFQTLQELANNICEK